MKLQSCAVAVTLGLIAPSALADFSGQTFLGPISNLDVVSGNTAGSSDDNDGFESGFSFFGIWDGGDDVWELNWLGGDLVVTLDSLGGSDNDLFIYTPSSYNSSADYSIVGAHDEVTILGAVAGTYYINVDSTASSSGAYNLAVTPAPASAALLGAGMLGLTRRRR